MRCAFPDEINWPEGEDAPPLDSQELITLLLRQNPLERMGTGTNAASKDNVARPVTRLEADRRGGATVNSPATVSATSAPLIIPSHRGRN